ncbi:MAG: hypothetical protein V1709_11300 [Planctomycetota bacterium]
MARPYRLEAEDTCYHITSRGNERKQIFDKDRDYKKFIEYVIKAKEKYKFYLYGDDNLLLSLLNSRLVDLMIERQ